MIIKNSVVNDFKASLKKNRSPVLTTGLKLCNEKRILISYFYHFLEIFLYSMNKYITIQINSRY